jgi:hypothetical protein
MQKAKLAHRTPGRIRLKLDSQLKKEDAEALIRDLKVSPEISKVTYRGSSLIIEHADDTDTNTAVGKVLSSVFPGFEDWSNEVDETIAKVTADPWINKMVPLGFLGLAVYTGMRSGAVLAGESAFALGYVAFDLYWKFQQENVVRKIEKGLSEKQRDAVGQSAK